MKLNFHTVITHDTTFHADDVIAVALLRVAGYKGFSLIRTRDKDILDRARIDPQTLVLDTGMVYDPGMLNFDHHQKKELRSAAGLIFMEIRREIIQDGVAYFSEFIDSIDSIDTNRNHIYHLWDRLPRGFRHTSAILGGYNRDVTNAQQQDEQFEKAVIVAEQIIRNEIYAAQRKYESMQQYYSRKILPNNVAVFDDYSTVWKEMNDHMFVVLPHANGWQIQTADTATGVVPESVCEVPGFIFRHISGFMAVVREKEDAVAFARSLPLMFRSKSAADRYLLLKEQNWEIDENYNQ